MIAGGSRPENGPQPQTRIRRWRRYQPAANLNAKTPQTSSGPSARPLRKGVELEFINTAHPQDATSSTAISSIRTHTARDIHASRRRASASQPQGGERRRMQVDGNRESDLTATWPVNLMIPVYNDRLNCFARPITNLEHFLLDYCK